MSEGGRGSWRSSVPGVLRELSEIESRMRRDYAAALAVISELEVRDAASECGYRGLGELLRGVLRISPREAKRRIQHARSIISSCCAACIIG